ncbi:MAG: ATP-binding protein [Candidatus Cloacimonetes bacterium]|nr:ATP-binding protein [Candidatus Cloacimonadota bacterium]
MESLIVKIKNSLPEIARVTEEFENFAEEKELSQRIVYDVSLCLDELITNIVSYGFHDKKVHTIEIQFHLKEKEIKLVFIDDGFPFDPVQKEDPEHLQHSVEERPIGGLGIYLVKKLMDIVKYRRVEDKNILTLTKFLKKSN